MKTVVPCNDFYVYHVILENGKQFDDTADNYAECCERANLLSYRNKSPIMKFWNYRNDIKEWQGSMSLNEYGDLVNKRLK